jgi:hypothetical protein
MFLVIGLAGCQSVPATDEAHQEKVLKLNREIEVLRLERRKLALEYGIDLIDSLNLDLFTDGIKEDKEDKEAQ